MMVCLAVFLAALVEVCALQPNPTSDPSSGRRISNQDARDGTSRGGLARSLRLWPLSQVGVSAAARVSNGSFDEYLNTCQHLHPDAIVISCWFGRLGNRLWQVHIAVIMALKSGRKFVQIPTSDVFGGVFEFPDGKIPIDNSKVNLGSTCDFKLELKSYDCSFGFYQWCGSSVRERKAVYQAYLLPYLKASNACVSQADHVLTLHIRSGDAVGWGGCHTQPPCDYFDRVLDEGMDGGPFQAVHIVASDEQPENPCIAHIFAKHANKAITVTKGSSIATDFCTLVKASNLAVTTSSFSTTAKMMNTKLARFFYPDVFTGADSCGGVGLHIQNYDLSREGVCTAFPMAVRYQEGWGLSRCGDK